MGPRGAMSKLDDFQEQASRAFAFLDEYGFARDRHNTEGAESYIRFDRGDMVVTVNYQLGDEPWVTVSFPDRGQRTSLTKLARELGISRAGRGIAATLQEQVNRDATLLRTYLEARRPAS